MSKQSRARARRLTKQTTTPMMAAAMKRRKTIPTIVTGVTPLDTIKTLTPNELCDLKIDSKYSEDASDGVHAYQRERARNHVGRLITAVRLGGMLVDPISVAIRAWLPDRPEYIVDGQQRYWAHIETETPARVQYYVCDSLDAERNLFIALNNRKPPTAGDAVQAHAGEFATLLRTMNADPKSLLFERITFGAQQGRRTTRPFSAAGLVRATGAVFGLVGLTGSMSGKYLPRIDYELENNPKARRIAERFLALCAILWIPGEHAEPQPPPFFVKALGVLAHKRWKENGNEPYIPPIVVINRLRKLDWDRFCLHRRDEFMPSLQAQLERRWKATSQPK